MKDKPEDVAKILDRYNALQNDIAAFKKEGGPYATLVEQLGLGQRMIKGVSRQTGKDTTTESAYQMTFTEGNPTKFSEGNPTEFTVRNGTNTRQSASCYVIGAASESDDPSCYRVRLYLSEACTGSTTDGQGKPCLVLEWPRGDAGANWAKGATPTCDHEVKAKGNPDYKLWKVGCAGISTKATGLGVSSSAVSLGFTGASVGFNVLDLVFGIKAFKFRGLDYSVSCVGSAATGAANNVHGGGNNLNLDLRENVGQNNIVEVNDNNPH